VVPARQSNRREKDMAYGNNNSGNFARKPASGSTPTSRPMQQAPTTEKVEAIFRTGLFLPDREGVAAMASVQVKEDVTIPAGSYITIYKNDDKKSEKSPDFSLVVKPGKAK
jgi:hypothetical protein